MISAIYFVVVFLACVLGAVVGLGGGVFVRPIFDAIGYHNVLNIQFFSSTAILTMAAVSTTKKLRDGTKIDFKIALLISAGAIIGGILGNLALEFLVRFFEHESTAQRIQITLTVLFLALSIYLTLKVKVFVELFSKSSWGVGQSPTVFLFLLGLILGAEAAFLGIGGGPVNVPAFMILFGFDMKTATAYSIVVIFFSHLSRLVTMGFTVGYSYFDLPVLLYVVPAAALGGFLGAKFSGKFSEETVKKLFVAIIFSVMIFNAVNGLFII
jgi:uncharacterized membrane protein YfcA